MRSSLESNENPFSWLIHSEGEAALLGRDVIQGQVIAQSVEEQIECWIPDLFRERETNRQFDRISRSDCLTISSGQGRVGDGNIRVRMC